MLKLCSLYAPKHFLIIIKPLQSLSTILYQCGKWKEKKEQFTSQLFTLVILYCIIKELSSCIKTKQWHVGAEIILYVNFQQLFKSTIMRQTEGGTHFFSVDPSLINTSQLIIACNIFIVHQLQYTVLFTNTLTISL